MKGAIVTQIVGVTCGLRVLLASLVARLALKTSIRGKDERTLHSNYGYGGVGNTHIPRSSNGSSKQSNVGWQSTSTNSCSTHGVSLFVIEIHHRYTKVESRLSPPPPPPDLSPPPPGWRVHAPLT